jgi:hypothetical protein
MESNGWDIASEVVGWVYFFAWSISFYPQIFVNYNRKRYFRSTNILLVLMGSQLSSPCLILKDSFSIHFTASQASYTPIWELEP